MDLTCRVLQDYMLGILGEAPNVERSDDLVGFSRFVEWRNILRLRQHITADDREDTVGYREKELFLNL